MLARLRAAKENGEGGFTLIELLVVMIIIGILAAVAIPVFLSQRAKAQDAATKADASTVGKEVATYYVDSSAVPAIEQTAARKYTVAGKDAGNASDNVTLGAEVMVSSSAWCVPFTNSKGDKPNWVYSAAGGLQEGTCAATGLRAAP